MFSLTTLKSDTLAIPALLSISSAILLLVRFISTSKFVKNLFKVEDEEEFEPVVEEASEGCIAKLHHHAKHYGGVAIFVYRILRLLAVLGLVGLAIATIVLGDKDNVHTAHRFLNWSVLGVYVRFSLFLNCQKSSPSRSSMRLPWL